jgi:hypothetical protein
VVFIAGQLPESRKFVRIERPVGIHQ